VTGPSFTYLVESLPWALAGFLVGRLATVKAQTPAAHQEAPVTTPTTPPRRRITVIISIGLVVVVLTILSAVQSWLAQQANDRLTKCLVSYANATADSIEARSKASSEAQIAQVQMWRAVFQQAQTDEGRAAARELFEDYLDKQDAAIKIQQTHPFPPAPHDVCPAEAR
jgi:hypothetical protein